MQASLRPGFPLTEVVVGLFAIPVAAFLGVSQGIVLSNVYRRNVVGLWLLANLFDALLVGIVEGIQFHELAKLIDGRYNLDEATVATANAFYLVGSLLSVVLYAAVTGPTLFVLARPRSGAETSLAMSSGSPAGALTDDLLGPMTSQAKHLGVSARSGIAVRRAALAEDEVVNLRGMRATSIHRTLGDLCGRLSLTEAVVVVDMALHVGVASLPDLNAWVATRARGAGVVSLRRVAGLAEPGAESPMET